MKNGQHYARTHQLFSEAPSLGHICPVPQYNTVDSNRRAY
jgi:hypothetical protein